MAFEVRSYRWWRIWVLALGLVSAEAWAGEDDIPLDEEEQELDKIDDKNGKASSATDDLLGADGKELSGDGRDTDSIYRDYLTKMKGLGLDEELESWERYLEKYPRTLYKDRVSERMSALESQLYAERIDGGSVRVDADKKEVNLSQGLDLDNLNPRTRMQFGAAWGLPSYANVYFDYERQLRRNFSLHAGVRRRYTGARLEFGAHYAFIKSTRTQSVVGLIADLAFNTVPAYPVIRPQLGAGKKFGKKLDAQIQAGVEIDPRKNAAVRGIGGVNVTYRAAPTVGVFAESTFYMQNLKTAKGRLVYRFNTFNFGMKFYPKFKGMKPNAMEINLGASAPYTSNYWMYHFGAVNVQGVYYF